MGTDNLFWKRKNQSLRRKSRNRGKTGKSFLIVCEGGETEPNYFRAFRLSSATVQVKGCGRNTRSLVEKALEIRKKAKDNDEIFDEVWCVFDRDSFSLQDFNSAFDLAKREKINIAYSNEAFELWYLLHFHYFNTGISRNDYQERLSKLLKEPYKKNSTVMYLKLLDKQSTAIKNAENLLETYAHPKPGEDNPSTTVHLLVKELNKFLHG
jgi:hypothetical protein